MVNRRFAAALAAALLVSTAAVAQDDTHSFFSLSGTGGVAVMALPGLDNIVTQGPGAPANGNVLATGATIGLSFATGIGSIGGYDTFLGGNAFATYVSATGSSTKTFTGSGLLVIPGFSTPANGSITLTTSRTSGGPATAGLTVNSTNPEGGTASQTASGTTTGPGDGGQSGSAAKPGSAGNSFIFGGGNTQVASGVATALAYGAIADSSGSIFIAVGDLAGLSVSSSSTQSAIYTGADITFGATSAPENGMSVQGYIGPSYRYMGQKGTSDIAVDIPEVSGQPAVHPLYSLKRDVDLKTHYLGSVAGIGFSKALSDTVTFSLGAEGAVYLTQTNATGNESVTISGGSGVAGLPFGPQTVQQANGSASANGFAYAVRAQTAVTFALSQNMHLTLAGSADYLSSVARGGNANVAYTNSAPNANASWASGGGAPLLSFGDMWSFTGTASLTGSF